MFRRQPPPPRFPRLKRAGRFAGRMIDNPAVNGVWAASSIRGLGQNMAKFRRGERVDPLDPALNAAGAIWGTQGVIANIRAIKANRAAKAAALAAERARPLARLARLGRRLL